MSTPDSVANYLSVMQSLYHTANASRNNSKVSRKAEIANLRNMIQKQISELGLISSPSEAKKLNLIEKPQEIFTSDIPNLLETIGVKTQTVDQNFLHARSKILDTLDGHSNKEKASILNDVNSRYDKLQQLEESLVGLNEAESRIDDVSEKLTVAEAEYNDVISEVYRRGWAHFRNARIIDIPKSEFAYVQRAFERYGSSTPSKPVDGVPYPERVPFSDIYFSFGTGIPYDIEGDNALLYGILVTPSLAAGVFRIERKDRPTNHILLDCWYNDGFWRSDFWIPHAQAMVISLVDLVNNYRTFVLEEEPTESTRIKYRKLSKSFIVKRPIPQPYYTIKLKSKTIHSSMYRTIRRLAQYSIEYSYRFDVRGHERCKVQRGKLPIDPKKLKTLTKRGYTIFDTCQPSEEVQKLLHSRHIPLRRSDEWLAVKIFWVSEHMKGPDGKPYVPAVRIMGGEN